MASTAFQFGLYQDLPANVRNYPQIRYMGSKFRLLPWIFEILSSLDFRTALDAFSGSGCVSYLLKSMGKKVTANDFLHFCATIATASIENSATTITKDDLDLLIAHDPEHEHFITRTFHGIFFTVDDLEFLDQVWWNIRKIRDGYKRAIAISALIRSCVKRQPRGVFTVAGDPKRYKDNRRDLKLSLQEHFREQVAVYNSAVFDNRNTNRAMHRDVFDIEPGSYDLVYLDPPYVPRADDNCYIKRYHFLEGLSCYWEGLEIVHDSRVKKLRKPFTPFSYRGSSVGAFDRMFAMFKSSIIVLSYSSNGYPDLSDLVDLLKRHKKQVRVFEKEHRYNFGTHSAATRNLVREYLIVGY